MGNLNIKKIKQKKTKQEEGKNPEFKISMKKPKHV